MSWLSAAPADVAGVGRLGPHGGGDTEREQLVEALMERVALVDHGHAVATLRVPRPPHPTALKGSAELVAPTPKVQVSTAGVERGEQPQRLTCLLEIGASRGEPGV